MVISGWTSDDIINAGAGNNVLNGSIRSDTYIFNKSDSADIIQDASGNDIFKHDDEIKKKIYNLNTISKT